MSSFTTGTSAFPAKLSASWAHASGFSIDKLETDSGNLSLEASVSNLSPGLKFIFAGDRAGSKNLGLVYQHKLATLSTDVDVANWNNANISFLGGSNGFLVGGATNLALGGKFELKNYSAALGWTPKENVFVGVQANNKFADFNGSIAYRVQPKLSISALIDFAPKATSDALKVSISSIWDCCDNHNIKLKVNNDGLLNIAATRVFPKEKFTVTGAAAVDTSNPSGYKVGFTATLG